MVRGFAFYAASRHQRKQSGYSVSMPRKTISNQLLLALCAFLLCVVSLKAWAPLHLHHSSRQPALSCRGPRPQSTITFALADDEGKEELVQDNTNEESTAVYGVSYIGGDPCGSKYNDDPFDSSAENSFKPGLPDDMKDRIAALAAKKSQEKKEGGIEGN